MYGYIYLTTNKVNEKLYVGQKKGKVKKSYLGSGVAIKNAIQKYGKENFTIKVLCFCDSQDELDERERYYISLYRNKYGRNNLYNIRDGGHESGISYSKYTDEEKKTFIDKMTKINKERCNTPEFKAKLSKATTERYKDPVERERHSKKVREVWSDKILRKKQSERLKAFYKDNTKDCSFNYQKCVFEFNDIYVEFESVKDLWKYLSDEWNYHPDRRMQKKLFQQGKERIPYKAFHSRFKRLDGMLIYKLEENVKTKADECKPQ